MFEGNKCFNLMIGFRENHVMTYEYVITIKFNFAFPSDCLSFIVSNQLVSTGSSPYQLTTAVSQFSVCIHRSAPLSFFQGTLIEAAFEGHTHICRNRTA